MCTQIELVSYIRDFCKCSITSQARGSGLDRSTIHRWLNGSLPRVSTNTRYMSWAASLPGSWSLPLPRSWERYGYRAVVIGLTRHHVVMMWRRDVFQWACLELIPQEVPFSARQNWLSNAISDELTERLTLHNTQRTL